MKPIIYSSAITLAILLSGCSTLPAHSAMEPAKGAASASSPIASAFETPVTLNGTTLSIRWEKNPTAEALLAEFPLTTTLKELNGNEKFVRLPAHFPSDPQPVHTIHAGDVMLFEDNCLVIFYQDFQTTYTYTRLGRITDPTHLAKTMGEGTVAAAFTR